MFANFHTSVKPQRVPECNCFDRSRATKVLVPMSVIFALNQRIRIFFNKMKYITIHNITSQGISIIIGYLDGVCEYKYYL